MKRYYAPWELKGDGYIILYNLPQNFLLERAFIPNNLKKNFIGGLSALIIVNYKNSNVGAYKEILFLSGLFRFNGKKHFSISKIYVDSEESIFNGYENWAIPKEYANFDIENLNDIKISTNNELFFNSKIKSSLIKIPFNSKILNLSLIQCKNDETFITNFYAKGFISKSDIQIESINEKYLPNLKNFKPLMSFKISDFNMYFKEAKIFNE